MSSGQRPGVNVEVMLDRESLDTSIEYILGGGEGAADALAGLFVELKLAIEAGLRGIERASEALSVGVELAYLRSRSHEAARRLYVLSREGQLRVEDEPLRLIGAAIGRGTGATSGSRGAARGRAGVKQPRRGDRK